jgi:alpha-1,3-glucosyltransferase
MKKELDPIPFNFVLFLFGFAALLRILVGFHPHSGQNNFHGSMKAYGGDFEAQRHWMEITYHLPIGDWYWYDLQYWGLDYPPLTAYVSYLCGVISHYVVGPESVALDTSRGIEDPVHKAYMRTTVLVLDLLIYGSAVWYSSFHRDRRSLWAVLVALAQPAIILVDHGHFQYNTVALGLSISAFSYMVQADFGSCIFGSFLFCLALNFKQMTLYYAPAVFFYLLGRCASQPKRFLLRFLLLGFTVLFTFGILWEPFLKYGPSHMATTPYERAEHILRRIFPFERGLFEGKVANLWCALSTKPVNIRERIDSELQPLIALGITFAMAMPSSYSLFCVGRNVRDSNTRNHWIKLLWGTTSSALSFFLASFQVHEKSILLALAPCTLLLWEDPAFVEWFSIVCVWSLWPLLQVDRLHVAYVCTVTMFGSLIWFRRMGQSKMTIPIVFSGIFQVIPLLSYLGMLGLHAAQIFVEAPSNLPDLFEVLWSVAGCGMFFFAWLVTCGKLFQTGTTESKIKTE